eukprot:PhF_6_TR10362/c0_g1_i2/m.16058
MFRILPFLLLFLWLPLHPHAACTTTSPIVPIQSFDTLCKHLETPSTTSSDDCTVYSVTATANDFPTPPPTTIPASEITAMHVSSRCRVRRNAVVICAADSGPLRCQDKYCFHLEDSGLSFSVQQCSVFGLLMIANQSKSIELRDITVDAQDSMNQTLIITGVESFVLVNSSFQKCGNRIYMYTEPWIGCLRTFLVTHTVFQHVNAMDSFGSFAVLNNSTLIEVSNFQATNIDTMFGVISIVGKNGTACSASLTNLIVSRTTSDMGGVSYVSMCNATIRNVEVSASKSQKWGSVLAFVFVEFNEPIAKVQVADVVVRSVTSNSGGIINFEIRRYSRASMSLKNISIKSSVSYNGAITVTGLPALDTGGSQNNFDCAVLDWRLENIIVESTTKKVNRTIPVSADNAIKESRHGTLNLPCMSTLQNYLFDFNANETVPHRTVTPTLVLLSPNVTNKSVSYFSLPVVKKQRNITAGQLWVNSIGTSFALTASVATVAIGETHSQHSSRYRVASYAATPCTERIDSVWEMTWELHPAQTTLRVDGEQSDHFAAVVYNMMIVFGALGVSGLSIYIESSRSLNNDTNSNNNKGTFVGGMIKRGYPSKLLPVVEYFQLVILGAGLITIALFGWGGIHLAIVVIAFLFVSVLKLVFQVYVVRDLRGRESKLFSYTEKDKQRWHSDAGVWDVSDPTIVMYNAWINKLMPNRVWYLIFETVICSLLAGALSLNPRTPYHCHVQSFVFVGLFGLQFVVIALARPFVSPIEFGLQVGNAFIETLSSILVLINDDSSTGDVAMCLIALGAALTATRIVWKTLRRIHFVMKNFGKATKSEVPPKEPSSSSLLAGTELVDLAPRRPSKFEFSIDMSGNDLSDLTRPLRSTSIKPNVPKPKLSSPLVL